MSEEIVLDCGSGFVKVGFAGEDLPRTIFPSIINKSDPSSPSNLASGLEEKQVQSTKNYDLNKKKGFKLNFNERSNSLPSVQDVISKKSPRVIRDKMLGWNGIMGDNVNCSSANLAYPFENGEMKDLEDLKKIWKFSSDQPKMLNSFKDNKVLITEPIFYDNATESRRVEIAKYFFETLQTSAIYFAPQTVLDVFSQGKTSSFVVDIGDSLTQIVPVFEGFNLSHAQLKIPLGGRDVSNFLEELFKKRLTSLDVSKKILRWGTDSTFREATQLPFGTVQCQNYVNEIKEKMCKVMIDPNLKKKEKNEFILPDKSVLTITSNEIYNAPEIFFQPFMFDQTAKKLNEGLPDMIYQVFKKIELDEFTHKLMKKNFLISGGGSMIKGMKERLEFEVNKLFDKNTGSAPPSVTSGLRSMNSIANMNKNDKNKSAINSPNKRFTNFPLLTSKNKEIFVEAPFERNMSSWIGGSMLATITPIWITKNDYYEKGEDIVFEKFF